jgi:hypothetical protein
VGWALVSAWSQRRYLRLLLTYALAVFIHGLWNGMAVLSIVPSLQGLTNLSIPSSLIYLGNFSDYGIIILGVIVLVLYVTINNILQHQSKDPQVPSSSQDGTENQKEDLPSREDDSNLAISEPGPAATGEAENMSQAPGDESDHPSMGE